MTRSVDDGRRRRAAGEAAPPREFGYYDRCGVRDSPSAMPVWSFAVVRSVEVERGQVVAC